MQRKEPVGANRLTHDVRREADVQCSHQPWPERLLQDVQLTLACGKAKGFDNGRQLAAWLGLVPRQHSSGGKPTLLGISKRGDTYLRTQLIHGARAVVQVADRKPDHSPTCRWASKMLQRRNKNNTAVALANKNARTVWALLAHGRQYQSDYVAQ